MSQNQPNQINDNSDKYTNANQQANIQLNPYENFMLNTLNIYFL